MPCWWYSPGHPFPSTEDRTHYHMSPMFIHSYLTIPTQVLLVWNILFTLMSNDWSQSFSSVSSKVPWNTYLKPYKPQPLGVIYISLIIGCLATEWLSPYPAQLKRTLTSLYFSFSRCSTSALFVTSSVSVTIAGFSRFSSCNFSVFRSVAITRAPSLAHFCIRSTWAPFKDTSRRLAYRD